jgi:hypothetical protein
VEVAGTRTFAEDCCELTVERDGVRVAAVVWSSVKRLAAEAVAARHVDLLFHIEPDAYQKSGAKLIVADVRRNESAERGA